MYRSNRTLKNESKFRGQISEGSFHRHRMNPVTTLLKNEGHMLAALETNLIFDWSFAVVLDGVRELSRAAFSTLYCAFRELPAHVQSRNHARKVLLQVCNKPVPIKHQ